MLREQHRLRVFEKKVLTRIFAPKSDEVKGGWRKVNNEELHNLYSSPNIIRLIKSRRVGYVVNMREMRNAPKILDGRLNGRDYSEATGIYGRKILKWTLGILGGRVWTRNFCNYFCIWYVTLPGLRF
jgi:hypothetical protein